MSFDEDVAKHQESHALLLQRMEEREMDRDRAERHHEVFLKMLEIHTSPAMLKSSGASLSREHVEACRRIADLAYPKP